MENLDLKKLWEVCNILSNRADELSEDSVYIEFLGNQSGYFTMEFDSFLRHYSFKIEGDNVVVFNTDGIPYEDYNNNDFSYVPICLLSFDTKRLENWMEEEVEKQLREKEVEKLQQKDYLKNQIKRLQNQLDNL